MYFWADYLVMISILIPTYNYNVVALVKELHHQILDCNIDFEMLVYDDGSKSPCNTQNAVINSMKNCTFKELDKNIGRSAIRNLLAKEAKFNWLLFLDADVMPINDNFIQVYINLLSKNPEVIYGGIQYQKEKPEKDRILRWLYGRKREALNVSRRNKDKYLRFLTLNFLTTKLIFEKVRFDETIPNLRHEDTLFSYHLKAERIKVEHINNPVHHLGLDTSEIFVKKSLDSVRSLLFLIKNNYISYTHTKITKAYSFVKKIHLNSFLAYLYQKHGDFFTNNLLSKKPSLFVLDLYRLSYLCFIDKSK